MAANPIRLETNNRFERLSFSVESLVALFDHLSSLRPSHRLSGELSVAFLDDAELVRIHTEFMEDPTVTDVITFPGDSEDGLAGEICVSVNRAEAEAAARGDPLARELTLYLVHGWLHLVGFNDVDYADRRAMRLVEEETMNAVEEAGLVPDFRLAQGLPAE